jgi:putative transposase
MFFSVDSAKESASLGMDLSLGVITQAAARIGDKQLNGALIHSDQGFHYTHPFYSKRLADLSIVQSMSRKGNYLTSTTTTTTDTDGKEERWLL